jgi:hypothetical protein
VSSFLSIIFTNKFFIETFSWKADPNVKHFSIGDVISHDYWGDKKIATTTAVANLYGPAFADVRFNTQVGPLMMLHSITPIEPMVQKLVQYVYAPRKLAWLAKFIIISEKIQVTTYKLIYNKLTIVCFCRFYET